MNKKVTIEVTQQDIDEAVRKKAKSMNAYRASEVCVISTACQRQLGDPKITSSFLNLYTHEPDRRIAVLPESAIEVTHLTSDQWKNVKPFSFEIELIEEAGNEATESV